MALQKTIQTLYGNKSKGVVDIALAEWYYQENDPFHSLVLITGTIPFMENKRDIGTMPWGAAALNGEILIEEIAPHRAGFRPAADIAHGRLPEQYIQKRQVGGAAFGVGGVEQRQQGRGLLPQELDRRSDQVFIRDTRLDKETVYKCGI